MARIVLLLSAVAVLATLAVRPDLAGLLAGATAPRSSDRPDDWYETTADEQLRFDQCLMSDGLRLGGPGMSAFAQDALNQSPQKLHELAALDDTFSGPLKGAYDKDKSDFNANWDRLLARRATWEKPVHDLETPGGFTDAGFHWVPGVHEGGDFYDQTGLGKWAGGPDWTQKFDFYDPTPKADEKTLKAVDDLGTPLYGKDPSSVGLSERRMEPRSLAGLLRDSR